MAKLNPILNSFNPTLHTSNSRMFYSLNLSLSRVYLPFSLFLTVTKACKSMVLYMRTVADIKYIKDWYSQSLFLQTACNGLRKNFMICLLKFCSLSNPTQNLLFSEIRGLQTALWAIFWAAPLPSNWSSCSSKPFFLKDGELNWAQAGLAGSPITSCQSRASILCFPCWKIAIWYTCRVMELCCYGEE